MDLLPKWIRANGLEFAFLEAGEGPLVLCLHGFPDTAWSFQGLLRRLAADGFRAVAPFMRGYAPSAIPPDGDYRATTLARDVIALIEHFRAPQAFVVGHDWGAIAAYVAATLRPDRVTRVVAAAVPHPRRFLLRLSMRQLYRSRYIGFFQLPWLPERRLRRNVAGWLDALVREWSPDWSPGADDLAPARALLDDPERRHALLGYYRALPRELSRAETWDVLNRPLPVPAQVIYGENDGCIGREMFQDMEHLFAAGFTLTGMAGAGHFMHREQPQRFADAVSAFLLKPGSSAPARRSP